MIQRKRPLQSILYRVFLVSCGSASILGVAMIWGLEPSPVLARVLGTLAVVAVASALTMSATRLAGGGPPQEDG